MTSLLESPCLIIIRTLVCMHRLDKNKAVSVEPDYMWLHLMPADHDLRYFKMRAYRFEITIHTHSALIESIMKTNVV